MTDPYAFEERAAIREFDAGFGRAKAEWLARADLQLASEAARRDRLALRQPASLPLAAQESLQRTPDNLPAT